VAEDVGRRGVQRWWYFYKGAIWQGTLGLWHAIDLLAGVGLVATVVFIVGVGITLAAVLNVAWLFAAFCAVLSLVVLVGAYRMWSRVEIALVSAQDELESPETLPDAIPDDHRMELQAVAEGIERYLDLERQVRYHSPGRDGNPPVARSFRTHFPDLCEQFDQWDKQVVLLDASRRRMSEWVETELAKQGVTHFGPLGHHIAGRIEHVRTGSLEWTESEGWLWVAGFAIIDLRPGDQVEELKEPFDSVVTAASDRTEALLLQADRVIVDGMKRDLHAQLENIRATHVIRGECELCGRTTSSP
jgi:hypothetical protein